MCGYMMVMEMKGVWQVLILLLGGKCWAALNVIREFPYRYASFAISGAAYGSAGSGA